MDDKKATELLVRIESEFDVNSVVCDTVHVWPLVRAALWKRLKYPGVDVQGIAGGRHSVTLFAQERARDAYLLYGSIRGILEAFLHRRLLRRRMDDLKARAPVDVLFYALGMHYQKLHDDVVVNAKLDPIHELAREKGKCLKLELAHSVPRGRKAGGGSRYIESFSVPDCARFLRQGYGKQLLGGHAGMEIAHFDALQDVVTSTTGIELVEHGFVHQVLRMRRYRPFFDELLSILSPEVVFLVCFYDIRSMALIWACKIAGVRTVDVQHGKQGRNHGMFSHWSSLPVGGYDVLPDMFWVWGEETKRNLLRARRDNTLHYHRPVVGGNVWLSRWIHGGAYDVFMKEYESYIDWISKFRRRVLVSLQPIEEPLPNNLLEAVKNSPEEWIWLMRLHPHQRKDITLFQSWLERTGRSNYEIEACTEIQLYYLLKRIDVHVTCFSSVCYEALCFRKPTVFIAEIARVLYEDYIARGLFRFALSPEHILEQIEKAADENLPREPEPYIESTPERAREALASVLSEGYDTG